MKAISLKDVWLKYRIEFKENGKVVKEDFWALKEINIDVDKGEAIGIIGENGAGKTTLLKIIAGMLKPDRGVAQVNGTISTVMEIGAGFQRDLTGRENIYLISSFFGLTKQKTDARYNDIVKFASIGRFINAPVKTYSQGMYMRLAFAIAIHVNPDILLIDDVFVVGDIYAQRKCINKMFELREMGKTIIFVMHDLEMLKRICYRGIFLRGGEIIKDGPIGKVCSYYTETVGSKKGIAILQKGPLGVVFNNGKLILRWKDKTITSNLSGHSLMLSSGRQYVSNTAYWEIQMLETEREIVAIGKWPDLPVTQCWKIIFLNEKEFVWEITIYVSEEISIERFHTTIIFIDEYRNWFTLATEMNFPESFIHTKEWDCFVINNSLDKVIGLRSNDKTAESPPTIIFDRLQDNMQMISHVGNTGFEVNGRVIVYEAAYMNSNNNYIQGAYRCLLSKVRIFENEEEEKLRCYLNHTKQVMRESTIIRKDSLSVFCKDHNIEIYWQDKLLTRGIGLNTRFRCQDKNYSAQHEHWAIHKENNEEIVITISSDDKPPLTQIWKLKLEDDDSILWEIEMEIDEKIKIRNKQVELVFSEEYEKWFTKEESGGFERLEKSGNSVGLNKHINEYIGLERVYKMNDFILPGILFNHEVTIPKASYILKMDDGVLTTRLRYVEIDSKENFYTPPGRYRYFKGRIKVMANRQHETDLIMERTDKEPVIMNRETELFNGVEFNRLSLVFDYGKGRLFWEGIELSNGLGLYSSIFFGGIWYDSSQAFWEVRKLDKKRLVAIGRWPWMPVIQIWEIDLLNEKTLFWKIIKETWEDVILEREQVNIMLSDRYKEWFVHNQVHGKFPKRFSEHNGNFWDRLWCGDTVSPIGIKKCKIKKGISNSQFLPTVIFDCSVDCQARYSVIENTDNLFQARILQYELDSNQRSNSDENKNKYFEGQIKIVT